MAYVTGSLQVTAVNASGPYYTVSLDARVDHACPDPGRYGPPYCAFFPVVRKVPSGAECSSATTPMWVGPILETVGTSAFSPNFMEYGEGSATACLFAYEDGVYTLLASAPYRVPGGPAGAPTTYPGRPKPAPAPPPPAPSPPPAPAQPPAAPDFASGLNDAWIPMWMGRNRRSVSFSTSTWNVPPDVHVERFKAIVRRASTRWGLRAARTTSRRVRNRDGQNQVGFSWVLPSGTLGVQTDTFLVRRGRFCVRRSRSGRCARTRIRVVSRRLIDRDIEINAEPLWQQGPTYPAGYEYDLESVLIHELGHLAGNDHARSCRNTPMIPSLDAGEWWHTPGDYRFGRCTATASAAAGPTRRATAADHVTRTVTRPVPPGPQKLERARQRLVASIAQQMRRGKR